MKSTGVMLLFFFFFMKLNLTFLVRMVRLRFGGNKFKVSTKTKNEKVHVNSTFRSLFLTSMINNTSTNFPKLVNLKLVKKKRNISLQIFL